MQAYILFMRVIVYVFPVFVREWASALDCMKIQLDGWGQENTKGGLAPESTGGRHVCLKGQDDECAHENRGRMDWKNWATSGSHEDPRPKEKKVWKENARTSAEEKKGGIIRFFSFFFLRWENKTNKKYFWFNSLDRLWLYEDSYEISIRDNGTLLHAQFTHTR